MNDDFELEDRFRSAIGSLPVPAGPDRPKFMDAQPRRAGGTPWVGIAAAAAVIIAVGLLGSAMAARHEATAPANPAAALPARLVAGASVEGAVAAADPACELPVEHYSHLWPCQAVTVVTPTAGRLTVEILWDDPGSALGLRLPLDARTVVCCAPLVKDLTVRAGGEYRVEILFLNYDQAPGQRFTLRTSLAP